MKFTLILTTLFVIPIALYAQERTRWFLPTGKEIGTAVVCHGLNNRPEVMDEIIKELNANNFGAVRVTLTGHGESPKEKHKASATKWLQEISDATEKAKELSKTKKIFAVGFSLGAALEALSVDRGLEYKRMVFFAPSIRLNFTSQLARIIRPLSYFNIALLSLMPEEYRRFKHPSARSYDALFDVVDEISNPQNANRLNDIPTKIFMSEDDELISFSRTERWINQNQLTNWSIQKVDPKPTLESSLNHLVIDEKTLGQEEWQRVMRETVAFLKG